MEELFYLFALGAIISGIMVISAFSSVHSVLWLIMAFISASALFILLGAEFIAFIFLIVYVGAIAILFLFVIMMLNLTRSTAGEDMSNYLPAGFIVGVVFLFEVLVFRKTTVGGNWGGGLVKIPNIEVLGKVLYTDYYYLFIIASFILLVAMVGAIVLTHDEGTEIKIENRRGQDIFIQTSRQLWP